MTAPRSTGPSPAGVVALAVALAALAFFLFVVRDMRDHGDFARIREHSADRERSGDYSRYRN